MRYWIFLSLVALLFSGCADLKKSEQLEQIDSLKTSLDQQNDALNAFASINLAQMMEASEALTVRLKQLESDTIRIEEAKELNEFKRLRVLLPVTMQQQDLLEKETQLAYQRLSLLRKDIESGDGERHKYDTFIQEETVYVEKLSAEYTICLVRLEDLETNWSTSVEAMKNILTERIEGEEVQ